MAMPGKKFADDVVERFTKKPTGEPDGDEGTAPAGDAADDGDGDEDKPESGAKGKIMLAATRRSDPEALEEAVRAIVRECMDEYNSGK
jgi:hypothetical protein